MPISQTSKIKTGSTRRYVRALPGVWPGGQTTEPRSPQGKAKLVWQINTLHSFAQPLGEAITFRSRVLPAKPVMAKVPPRMRHSVHFAEYALVAEQHL
jgi:hypothetical protein